MTTASTVWKPPVWFWDLLESSGRTLQVLAEKLERLSEEQIRAFQQCYEDAKGEINPLYRDDLADVSTYLSEDQADDFTAWAVSQGRVFYGQVKNGPLLTDQFLETFRQHDEEGRSPELRWGDDVTREEYRGYQRPDYIAYAVYERRFHKSLYDELEPDNPL